MLRPPFYQNRRIQLNTCVNFSSSFCLSASDDTPEMTISTSPDQKISSSLLPMPQKRTWCASSASCAAGGGSPALHTSLSEAFWPSWTPWWRDRGDVASPLPATSPSPREKSSLQKDEREQNRLDHYSSHITYASAQLPYSPLSVSSDSMPERQRLVSNNEELLYPSFLPSSHTTNQHIPLFIQKRLFSFPLSSTALSDPSLGMMPLISCSWEYQLLSIQGILIPP